jgi:hypothetical protein
MARTGRPSKYTDELAAQIAQAVGAGLTNKHAAQLAGISEKSFQRWERTNVAFGALLARAHAHRAAVFLAKAREAGHGDWRFWLDLLDRCEPDYRKRNVLEMSGPDGGALEIVGIELPLPVRTDDPEDKDDDGQSHAPLLIPLPVKADGSGR